MYGTNYFRHNKGVSGCDEKVPIRWMAPESIEKNIYNEATDIVSNIPKSIILLTVGVSSCTILKYVSYWSSSCSGPLV